MKEIDPLVTVETICGFYHPSASFPIVLDELPQESDMCSLIHIGNLTNHDISVNHLSRHELLLLISDGSHGKDLVEYLYRERVFPDEYRNEGSNSGYAKYYFVYPCKYSETSVHNSSWLTKNLNRHSQDKIAESITYIPVVTDEKYLKMVSVFLLELSDTNSSSLSSTNAFIDTLVQNKASKVIVLLDSSSLNTNMLHYQQTILSIVESGQARKLNLFVHFDVGTNPQDTDGILAEFNKSLYDVFKGRHSADVAKQLSFNPISVPSGIQLIKHLLGANGTQLESFEEVIKSPELIIDSVEKHTESKDNLGIENVLEILEGINRFKMQLAAKRLEDDVKNLLAVSKKFVSENRNKERKNTIANIQKQFKQVQSGVVAILIISTLLIHCFTATNAFALIKRIDAEAGNSMSEYFESLSRKYTKTKWIFLYVLAVIYLFLFDYLGEKYLRMERVDKQKYNKQRESLKYLNRTMVKASEIKNRINS